jgi:hypothetical protein
MDIKLAYGAVRMRHERESPISVQILMPNGETMSGCNGFHAIAT